MVARRQRTSFESFRIAVIRRLWATVLIVKNDVCMVNSRMMSFTKRSRSKAFSAASLSPSQLVDRRRIASDFLPTPIATQSQGGVNWGVSIFIVQG
jgi:hypothetical protein